MNAGTVLTDELLERAWSQIAQPHWGSLADAKEGARHWGLVRLRAMQLASGMPMPTAEPLRTYTPPPPYHAPHDTLATRVLREPPAFDFKRAAAGERIDD